MTSYLRLPVTMMIISALLCILTLVSKGLLESVGRDSDWSVVPPVGKYSRRKPPIELPPDVHITSERNGTFRLAIFEDLHFAEAEDTLWGPGQDNSSINVMTTVLSAESPDLVVINGDLITGENTYPENSTSYLDILLRPIVRSGVKFATVYGNHDNNANISTTALYHREKDRYAPQSLTWSAVNGTEADVGVSNYFLPVFLPRTNNGQSSSRPDLLLWFFDSKGGHEYSPGADETASISGQVNSNVVNWFQTTSSYLKGYYGTELPALAFVHIPASIMGDFQTDDSPFNPYTIPGLNQDNPMDCQSGDDPFWQAMVNDTSIKAVFSAHDHGDDWCMPYSASGSDKKTFFCLGRHTGYGGYSNWLRGSRIVEVDLPGLDAGEVRTWVRFEDATAGQTIVLNSTYGTDEYEAVPLRCTSLGIGEVPCT